MNHPWTLAALTDQQLLTLESEARFWGHEGVAIMVRRALNGDEVAREACWEIWAHGFAHHYESLVARKQLGP